MERNVVFVCTRFYGAAEAQSASRSGRSMSPFKHSIQVYGQKETYLLETLPPNHGSLNDPFSRSCRTRSLYQSTFSPALQLGLSEQEHRSRYRRRTFSRPRHSLEPIQRVQSPPDCTVYTYEVALNRSPDAVLYPALD